MTHLQSAEQVWERVIREGGDATVLTGPPRLLDTSLSANSGSRIEGTTTTSSRYPGWSSAKPLAGIVRLLVRDDGGHSRGRCPL
jgi:hypothetical protein